MVNAFEENSPYPEVRAAVRNVSKKFLDQGIAANQNQYDEDLPANTIRSWTIGLILTTLGSALNMLFSMRAPSIIITSLVVQ